MGDHKGSPLQAKTFHRWIPQQLRIMHYELRIKHYYVQKHLFSLTILVKS
jgi:hypothetical protein